MREPLLKTPPAHVPYAFVRETGGAMHYAVLTRLRPRASTVASALKQFIVEAEVRLHRAAVAYAAEYDVALRGKRKGPRDGGTP